MQMYKACMHYFLKYCNNCIPEDGSERDNGHHNKSNSEVGYRQGKQQVVAGGANTSASDEWHNHKKV